MLNKSNNCIFYQKLCEILQLYRENFLLIPFSLMLNPSPGMALLGIVMGPVDDPAFVVPFILAVKRDCISNTQVLDAWREIDVVGNENRLALRDLNYKPLMPDTFVIILQDLNDLPSGFDLKIRLLLRVRVLNFLYSSRTGRRINGYSFSVAGLITPGA